MQLVSEQTYLIRTDIIFTYVSQMYNDDNNNRIQNKLRNNLQVEEFTSDEKCLIKLHENVTKKQSRIIQWTTKKQFIFVVAIEATIEAAI